MTERWTPSLEDFIDVNGLVWGTPDVITDAGTVERIAAGEVDRPEIVAWIERRTRAR